MPADYHAPLAALFSTHTLDTLLSSYGYGAVFLFVMVESLGIPLPGETMVIAAAAYAGATHHLVVWLIWAVAAAGAVIGDNIGFGIGHWGGYRILRRYGSKLRLDEPKLKVGRLVFDRHGGKVVFFGRFVSILRTYAAFLAGANRMEYPRFLAFNAAGGVVWSGIYAIAFYYAGSALSKLRGSVDVGIGVAAALVLVAFIFWIRRNEKRLEAEAERVYPGHLDEPGGKPPRAPDGTPSPERSQQMSQDSTARAGRLIEHGRPLVIEPVTLPEPSEGEVRVELRYGGVNPVDRYTAEGRVAPDGPLPRTLGAEATGVLDGRQVLVAGEGLGARRDGVWAQAAVVPEAAVLELPDGVSLRDAAAMGVAGLTAWKVVSELARVCAEDRVLVLGASGGVGSMIVSLAASTGARVWGQTGSERKAGGIREDGAERAVVAGPEQLADAVREFEPTVVIDPLGDGFLAPAVEVIALRGRIVSYGTSAGAEVRINLQTLYRKMVSLLGYGGMQLTRDERREGLGQALAALADGRLRVRIDRTLALDQVNEAFALLERREVQGKVLLELAAG